MRTFMNSNLRKE